MAGLVISESEYSHQALSDIMPLRDLFGLLFVVSVGMLLDPASLVASSSALVCCGELARIFHKKGQTSSKALIE